MCTHPQMVPAVRRVEVPCGDRTTRYTYLEPPGHKWDPTVTRRPTLSPYHLRETRTEEIGTEEEGISTTLSKRRDVDGWFPRLVTINSRPPTFLPEGETPQSEIGTIGRTEGCVTSNGRETSISPVPSPSSGIHYCLPWVSVIKLPQ